MKEGVPRNYFAFSIFFALDLKAGAALGSLFSMIILSLGFISEYILASFANMPSAKACEVIASFGSSIGLKQAFIIYNDLKKVPQDCKYTLSNSFFTFNLNESPELKFKTP